MKKNYLLIISIFFFIAIALRVFLCWYNPPENAFDNHFTPIELIINTGKIPAKDACWQCYHPPIFYYVFAIIAKAALKMQISTIYLSKILQCINCVYGILTIVVIYLILNKLKIPEFPKIFAFGTVCFLPRHIYMSAMFSNDAMSYLFVSLCAYLLLVAIEKKFSLISLAVLSIAIAVSIFIKYTNLVVIPMAIVTFIVAYIFRLTIPRNKALIALILILILPTVLFGIYIKDNVDRYGNPLPWNITFYSTIFTQIHHENEGICFFDFKPWQYIKYPIISPSQIGSFWTLIYSGMWFDIEPKFLAFTDQSTWWWSDYYAWICNGQLEFPNVYDPLSSYTHFLGAALITLGLLPLFFLIIGFCRAVFNSMISPELKNSVEIVKLQVFTPLLFFNIIGIMLLTITALKVKTPTFTFVKASYLLNSMSSFSVFIGLGLMYIDGHNILKKCIAFLFLILFLFSTMHIIQICMALISLPSETIYRSFFPCMIP